MRPRNGEQPDSMSDRGAGPRPFFLRFNATKREEREAAFLELCVKIGAPADKFAAEATGKRAE